jgi:hypothetical protein
MLYLTLCHVHTDASRAQAYADTGMEYDGSRVLNNMSGHCPAEPTSLAVAAAHHTLTKLLLFLVQYVKVRAAYKPAVPISIHREQLTCTAHSALHYE